MPVGVGVGWVLARLTTLAIWPRLMTLAGRKKGRSPGRTWFTRIAARVAADNVAPGKALDVVVEGVARRYVLEVLPANRLVEGECNGDHFGELATAYGVTGAEVGVVVGVTGLTWAATGVAC